MGRKGIGKLAMFALADNVKVSSHASGSEPVGLSIDVPEFKKSLEDHSPRVLDEFLPEEFKKGRGTRIELIMS